MIFWIDAQLPPSLAPWLTETFGVAAQSMSFIGLRDAEDLQIFNAAKEMGDVVIISKDSDFIELILKHSTPPRLLWITCGNVTNRRLREVFTRVFPEALDMLKSGNSIVEIGDFRAYFPALSDS